VVATFRILGAKFEKSENFFGSTTDGTVKRVKFRPPRRLQHTTGVNDPGYNKREEGQRSAQSLPFRHKRAIAFVEIKSRADAGDLERLSPPAGWKIIRTFDCFHFRF
jgi:hypothetical protein